MRDALTRLWLACAVSLALSAPARSPAADNAPVSWTRYHAFHKQLQFSYPADLLRIRADSETITLSHSIRFHHPNVCNFKDEEWLDDLIDFRMSLRLDSRDCMTAMKDQFPWSVTPRKTSVTVFGPDSLIRDD